MQQHLNFTKNKLDDANRVVENQSVTIKNLTEKSEKQSVTIKNLTEESKAVVSKLSILEDKFKQTEAKLQEAVENEDISNFEVVCQRFKEFLSFQLKTCWEYLPNKVIQLFMKEIEKNDFFNEDFRASAIKIWQQYICEKDLVNNFVQSFESTRNFPGFNNHFWDCWFNGFKDQFITKAYLEFSLQLTGMLKYIPLCHNRTNCIYALCMLDESRKLCINQVTYQVISKTNVEKLQTSVNYNGIRDSVTINSFLIDRELSSFRFMYRGHINARTVYLLNFPNDALPFRVNSVTTNTPFLVQNSQLSDGYIKDGNFLLQV